MSHINAMDAIQVADEFNAKNVCEYLLDICQGGVILLKPDSTKLPSNVTSEIHSSSLTKEQLVVCVEAFLTWLCLLGRTDRDTARFTMQIGVQTIYQPPKKYIARTFTRFGSTFISMFAMARKARFAGASFATTTGQLELCHPGRCPFTAWEVLVGSLHHITLKYLKVALQEAHHNGNNWSYWNILDGSP